ncbi:MAG TPA: hypothetical protein VL241_10765, partial [Gemmatimonadales bacterium]|nr:hypothetical protein [Gemmatimonadales bacterium]
ELGELLDAAREPTLFGEPRGLTAAERSRLTALRTAGRRAREQLRALRRAGELPWFHYPTHFADVFARGGFDLVVGNPPWVRAESLPVALRRYLVERFRWFRSGRTAARGYAHLPDLAVAFLERGLELAAPEGVVALLVPAKLATTGYAAAAREQLARRTTISLAADLAAEPEARFDATVYPMALVLRRAPPPASHTLRIGLASDAPRLPQRELDGAPWALVPAPAREVLRRLARDFPPLADGFACHLGVKTGLNRVFLDPPEAVEPELLRWAIRGRDVRPFRVRPVRRLLWPCEADGRPLAALPRHAARHLTAHAAELRRRADHQGGPCWRLFRTRPATAAYRVVWADVARRLEAAPLWQPEHRALIPLNTCYVLPAAGGALALRLAAWLNSTWCRALAAVSADPAAGGFARFNARAVGALPCPAALPDDPGLLELARAGCAGRLAQEALDDRCAELLGLAAGERAALAALAGGRPAAGR